MNAIDLLKTQYSQESNADWEEVCKHIVSNREIMDGLPTFKGTRIPVYIILDYLAEGYSPEEILKDYPSLNKDTIRAALKFANLLSSIH